MRSARIGSHEQEALSLAQSRLQAAAVPLHAGRQDGDDGPFHWTATVTRAAFGRSLDGGRRAISVDTQRLSESEGAP